MNNEISNLLKCLQNNKNEPCQIEVDGEKLVCQVSEDQNVIVCQRLTASKKVTV